MSCFLHDPEFVADLVEVMVRAKEITPGDAPALRRILAELNARSVQARYGDPMPSAEELDVYREQQPTVRVSHVSEGDASAWVCKMLGSWAYQSCESREVRETETWKWLRQRLERLEAHREGFAGVPSRQKEARAWYQAEKRAPWS